LDNFLCQSTKNWLP